MSECAKRRWVKEWNERGGCGFGDGNWWGPTAFRFGGGSGVAGGGLGDWILEILGGDFFLGIFLRKKVGKERRGVVRSLPGWGVVPSLVAPLFVVYIASVKEIATFNTKIA